MTYIICGDESWRCCRTTLLNFTTRYARAGADITQTFTYYSRDVGVPDGCNLTCQQINQVCFSLLKHILFLLVFQLLRYRIPSPPPLHSITKNPDANFFLNYFFDFGFLDFEIFYWIFGDISG